MGEKKVVWSRKLNIFFRHRYIPNETLKEKIVSMYQLFLIPEPKAAQIDIDIGHIIKAVIEIKRIEMVDKIDSKVRSLSGGQKRRVEIARALIHNPKLLLLDEPTVGLDIGSRQMILKHVKSLCKIEGLAVLWATHLIDEIDKGEKVVVIHNGVVLETGEVSKVVKKNKSKNIREAFNKLVNIRS